LEKIDNMDQQTATLYAEAMLGGDTDDFFNTEIGRYVLERSKEEADEAIEELKNISFLQSDKIAELQMKIKVAEGAVRWLNELLITGRQSMQLLNEGE